MLSSCAERFFSSVPATSAAWCRRSKSIGRLDHSRQLQHRRLRGRALVAVGGAMSKRKRTAAPSSERGRRVLAGLAKARAYGVKLGRPKVSTKAENAVR